MKVAEILRALADLVDATSPESAPQIEPELAVVQVDVEPDTSEELGQIAKLAGITRASTTPNEQIAPLEAAFPAGDDIHNSKNPADIRSDSVSMYPNFQAKF